IISLMTMQPFCRPMECQDLDDANEEGDDEFDPGDLAGAVQADIENECEDMVSLFSSEYPKDRFVFFSFFAHAFVLFLR
ncbi:hypothetical protein GGF32_007431, partial [Allomyces javanicus]